jgi:hypothetical protein
VSTLWPFRLIADQLCRKSEEVKVTVVTDCDRFGFAEGACHLLVSTATGASRTLCKNINIDAIYLVSHPKKHILVNSIADDVVTTRELVQPLHSQPACADLVALNDCTYAHLHAAHQHALSDPRVSLGQLPKQRRHPHPRGRAVLRSVAFSPRLRAPRLTAVRRTLEQAPTSMYS